MKDFTVFCSFDETLHKDLDVLTDNLNSWKIKNDAKKLHTVASYDSNDKFAEHVFSLFPCRRINENHGTIRTVIQDDFDKFNHYLIEMAEEFTSDLNKLSTCYDKKIQFDTLLTFISIFDYAQSNDVRSLFFLSK